MIRLIFIATMLATMAAPAMAQMGDSASGHAPPPSQDPVGLSINLKTSIDAVDSQGNRAPTGHELRFISAPGNIEQVMIQWYSYINRLTHGCDGEESLEELGARIRLAE